MRYKADFRDHKETVGKAVFNSSMAHPPPVPAWVNDVVNVMFVVDKTGWTIDYVRSLDYMTLMEVTGYYEGIALINRLQAERLRMK